MALAHHSVRRNRNNLAAHRLSDDGKGNLTGDRVWGYEYDPENRLVAARAEGGSLRVDYRYDAFGRQIERRTSGTSVTTNRMYYAGWQLIAEYNGAGTLQRKYVYGPGIDEPVRMTASSTKYFYHSDGLGSVTEITATNGVRRESYTYDVYGTPTMYNASAIPISQSTIGNRLMFTGRDRDPDTTLYNYRYRYYSPSLGRFVQPDPIGLRGGDLNLYRYAMGNPVGKSDPYGLAAVPQLWIPFAIAILIGIHAGMGKVNEIFDKCASLSNGQWETMELFVLYGDRFVVAISKDCYGVCTFNFYWQSGFGNVFT